MSRSSVIAATMFVGLSFAFWAYHRISKGEGAETRDCDDHDENKIRNIPLHKPQQDRYMFGRFLLQRQYKRALEMLADETVAKRIVAVNRLGGWKLWLPRFGSINEREEQVTQILEVYNPLHLVLHCTHRAFLSHDMSEYFILLDILNKLLVVEGQDEEGNKTRLLTQRNARNSSFRQGQTPLHLAVALPPLVTKSQVSVATPLMCLMFHHDRSKSCWNVPNTDGETALQFMASVWKSRSVGHQLSSLTNQFNPQGPWLQQVEADLNDLFQRGQLLLQVAYRDAVSLIHAMCRAAGDFFSSHGQLGVVMPPQFVALSVCMVKEDMAKKDDPIPLNFLSLAVSTRRHLAPEEVGRKRGSVSVEHMNSMIILITQLLRAFPRCASVVDSGSGRLPLHDAVDYPRDSTSKSWFPYIIRAIFESFPAAASRVDPIRRAYPWMMMIWNGGDRDDSLALTLAYRMLRSDPSTLPAL